jgi:hypothetical protein
MALSPVSEEISFYLRGWCVALAGFPELLVFCGKLSL